MHFTVYMRGSFSHIEKAIIMKNNLPLELSPWKNWVKTVLKPQNCQKRWYTVVLNMLPIYGPVDQNSLLPFKLVCRHTHCLRLWCCISGNSETFLKFTNFRKKNYKKVSSGMSTKIAQKLLDSHENIKELACIQFTFLYDIILMRQAINALTISSIWWVIKAYSNNLNWSNGDNKQPLDLLTIFFYSNNYDARYFALQGN